MAGLYLCFENSFFFFFVVLVVAAASRATIGSSNEIGFDQCENTVLNWASLSRIDSIEHNEQKLKDLLFFLHVPRTGGRSYFHCFLRKLYSSNQECPRSYDKLRFDPSKPNCSVMVTHDDYSMVSKLPDEKTSVVTIMRNPVNRVFSAYEFSVEVAARFLVYPNLSSAVQSTRIPRSSHSVSTLDIWPWKYLVPWMREDLFSRRDARGNKSVTGQVTDPYNLEEVVMPFQAFIKEPLAQDIIHNGATFQVAGITNNSYFEKAHEVRHCVGKYPMLGKYVLEVAKRRLDNMLFVGLTEKHKQSAVIFADVVGSQVLSQLKVTQFQPGEHTSNITEPKLPFLDPELEGLNLTQSKYDHKNSSEGPSQDWRMESTNMTVDKLMKTYEDCVSSLRKFQTLRGANSLKNVSPANFTKKARLNVPKNVVQRILSLNWLDVELFQYAEEIFKQQEEQFLMKTSEQVQSVENLLEDSWSLLSRWSFLVAATLLLTISSVLLINSRRRTSKLKI